MPGTAQGKLFGPQLGSPEGLGQTVGTKEGALLGSTVGTMIGQMVGAKDGQNISGLLGTLKE